MRSLCCSVFVFGLFATFYVSANGLSTQSFRDGNQSAIQLINCMSYSYSGGAWYVASTCSDDMQYQLLLNWHHTSEVLEFDGVLRPNENRLLLSDPSLEYSEFWFYTNPVTLPKPKSPSCAHGGDPVDLSNGQLYETAVDLIIHVPDPIVIQRYYDNQHGWQFSYTDTLSINTSNHYATLSRFGGLQFTFSFDPDASGGISPVDNSKGTLSVNAKQGIVTYLTPDGYVFKFRRDNGKLTQVVDPNSRVQTMVYDGNGNLSSITDGLGNTVSIVSHDGKFDSVTDAEGHTIHYDYDTKGNLTKVAYPSGRKVYYQYSNTDHPTYLTAILDANHEVVSSWGYNEQGQVIQNTVGQ